MSQNNVKLNEVKDFAFLADKSYKTANGKEGQLPKAKEGIITNPATNSSFEVVEQKNEYTAFGKGIGFSATVFKNTETNEYVIAFRGTNDSEDFLDDLIMGATSSGLLGDVTNKQFSQAFDFASEQIAKIQAQDPDAKISTTGTSLGGSLAQAVGAKLKLQTTTFNAYGIKAYGENILSEDEINSAKDYVTNIYDSRDPISNGALFGKQLGKSIPLDTGGNAISDFFALAAGLAGLAARLPGLPGVALAAGLAAGAKNLANLHKHFIENLIPNLDKVEPFLKADTLNISLYQPYDPIALDLNANGKIDTLTLENGVFFDHNGDEIAFKSSWISGGDGILARDINGDKEINSGAELFGNFTRLKNGELAKNGAEALKDLDDNNDGIFDSNDKAFNEILVWQDFNSNGKAESGELKSLSEHGIKSINLEFLDDNTALDKDNKQILIGSFKISSSVNSVKISA